jgi:type III pantothenate kinase
MKRWILDVGNTRAKWACFSAQAGVGGAPLFNVELAPANDPSLAATWQEAVAAEDAIMVTGSGDLEPWAAAFPGAWVLRPGDPTPLKSEVRERQTLGLDRVANATAVLHGGVPNLDPQGSWMIVDAGTCVTVDVVHQGVHLGGTISPGIRMRLRSMSEGTVRLPHPRLEKTTPSLNQPGVLGTCTEEALLGGVCGGLSAELGGKWAALRQEVPNLGVVLTGGDVPHLELRDIRPKFADAHLTLKGYHALFTHAHPHP